MSIEKIDSYSAICDHCGEVLETSHEGFIIFVDEQVAQEEIDRADWYTEEGYEEPDLHYCKSCHWVDDNDEMHLRMERRKDTPDTNPADMPSRPVEPEIMICELCKSEWDISNNLPCPGCGSRIVKRHSSTPSKEGASQKITKQLADELEEIATEVCPNEVYGLLPEEWEKSARRMEYIEGAKNGVEEGAELWKAEYENLMTRIKNTEPWPLGGYAPGNYSCTCCHCEKSFIGDKRAIACLDCSLSGIHVYVENLRTELSEMTSMRDLAKKEYDLTLKEVQTWKDECNTIGALLEGKNLENAGLKDEITAYQKALEPGTSVMTQIEILEKYKKEELK